MRLAVERMVGLLMACAVATSTFAGPTLEEVRRQDYLRCGVSTGIPGFSSADEDGHWRGLDVDLCRAVAAAVFGDAEKVKYVPLKAKQRLEALRDGEIDMLARNTTWTMERDITMGVNFVGVNYYDGQGFMVPRSMEVRSALELDGASICVQEGTTTETNLKQYFAINRMKYKLLVFDTPSRAAQAYRAGECRVLSSDQSQLYALRSRFSHPEESVVLPEVISKEPLGPAVREGDDTWFNIVQWVLFAMINAEEWGITSRNVERVKAQAKNPTIRRFLGLERDFGKVLGLDPMWIYQVIRQVGNYGESFDRNVGKDSALAIARGQNALWSRGGLLYAPPTR